MNQIYRTYLERPLCIQSPLEGIYNHPLAPSRGNYVIRNPLIVVHWKLPARRRRGHSAFDIHLLQKRNESDLSNLFRMSILHSSPLQGI
jgi:hypothetical protein